MIMATSYMIVDSDSGGSASQSFPASPLPTFSLGASRSPGVALTDGNWSGFASRIDHVYASLLGTHVPGTTQDRCTS